MMLGPGTLLLSQLVTWALLHGNGTLCYYIVAMTTLFMAIAVVILPSPVAPSNKQEAIQNTDAHTSRQLIIEPSSQTENGKYRAQSLDYSRTEASEQGSAAFLQTQMDTQVSHVSPQPDAHYPYEHVACQPSPVRQEHEHTQHRGSRGGSPARTDSALSSRSREIWAHSPVHEQGLEHATHEHLIVHARKPLLETRARVADQISTPGSTAATAVEAKPKHAWFVLIPALLVIFANISIELGFAGQLVEYHV
jgi:hypothetical protein